MMYTQPGSSSEYWLGSVHEVCTFTVSSRAARKDSAAMASTLFV